MTGRRDARIRRAEALVGALMDRQEFRSLERRSFEEWKQTFKIIPSPLQVFLALGTPFPPIPPAPPKPRKSRPPVSPAT